jgi:hypothetical protein
VQNINFNPPFLWLPFQKLGFGHINKSLVNHPIKLLFLFKKVSSYNKLENIKILLFILLFAWLPVIKDIMDHNYITLGNQPRRKLFFLK